MKKITIQPQVKSMAITSNNFLNPFHPQCSLLTYLETSENLWFSDVFRGNKREHLEEMGQGKSVFRNQKTIPLKKSQNGNRPSNFL